MKRKNFKKPMISALEQRILFDGAAVATAVDVLDESSFSSNNNTQTTTNSNDVTQNNAENSVHEAQAVQGFERPRREVAFVDITVKDYQTLVDGVGEGTEVYLVSSLDEIKTTLSSQTNIDAIHILSHGNTGEISVGNDLLNSNTLDDNAQLLETMKNSLSVDGDILLYGCNVASDGTGQEFINSIATLTQADVAASEDTTGNSALGGDWELEKNSGSIETDNFEIVDYDGKLVTTTMFDFSTESITGSGTKDSFIIRDSSTHYALKFTTADTSADPWAVFQSLNDGSAGLNTTYAGNYLYISNLSAVGAKITVTADMNNDGVFGDTFKINSFNFSDASFGGGNYVIKPNGIATNQETISVSGLPEDITSFIPTTSSNFDGITSLEIQFSSSASGIIIDNVEIALPTVSDTTPPTFGVAPATSNVTATTVDLSASLDEAGKIYYVVVADGATAPSIAQIKAGQDSTGASALKSGNSDVTATPFTGTYNITGLTANTAYDIYVVGQDDEGTPNVMTTATKVDVTTTTSVVNVNDAPVGTVSISGTVTQGQTLTASNNITDADGMGTVSYQWFANGVEISGATGSTYTLTQNEVNKVITVKASYTDGFGANESVTSSATTSVVNVNDAPVGTVSISGTVTQGQTLTASNNITDADGMGTVSYQWFANGVEISGATGSTYTLTQNEVNKVITVKASYTDGFGANESVTSSATTSVVNVNDAPVGTVTISGTVTQGQTLTASNNITDADGMGTVSYQWFANGVEISGATGSTYTLTQNEVNKVITVKASYTDGFGANESVTSSATTSVVNVNDAPVGTVSISGTVTQGQTLTASNNITDADGMGTVSYQWFANGVEISGATGSTYTLTQNEVNKAITVVASYTDGFGANETVTSSATTSVVNVNHAPVGTVTISGTVTQGQTLTASNNITDADGMGTISYQWYADGVLINGAVNSTYTLTQNEVNKVITVKASYTDGFGANETVTSSATTSVVNVNDAPVGTVTISGTVTQGQTLTASNNITDADGMGTISYQWYADGVLINGAVNSTYTLTQNEVNKAITVVASYTDGFGANETVTSSATTSVVNVNHAPVGTVTISGTVTQGQTLTASNNITDADGMGTISYQWFANGVEISGATGSTYTLTQNEVNKVITVKASYTDALGTAETVTSSATASVVNVNDAPVGTVTISGTVTQGQTLTASNNITDADGMGTISYQWYADGVLINGAVNSTYTLTQNEVNKAITVVASYTDALGTAETVTSSATASVVNVNHAPTVSNDNIDVKLSFGDAYQKDVSGLFSDIDFDNVFTYEAINLPLGLTMNSSTGVISGRANSSGEFKVIIKVTDNGTPALSVSRTYNMLVVAPPQVEISQNTSPKPSVDNTPIVNVNNITISTFTDTLSLGTINNNLGDTPADSVGNGYIDSNRENNNQENNNQPLQVNRTNSSNYIEANASLNVGFNGQISFDNTAQDSFSIVGIAIENMTIENNRLEIRVVDTNLAQNFIVTQIDGTALPTGLSFDPKTGNISGTIPENLDKLEITIKATNPDGTTRVLNLKLDLKELKKAQKNQVDADEKYMGLKEQIALENQKLDDYGSYLTRLFA